MIAHFNVAAVCDRALQNGANAVPASPRMEVEQAGCTAAQLLSISGRIGSPGLFPWQVQISGAWQGGHGEERLGELHSCQLEVRRVKRGPAELFKSPLFTGLRLSQRIFCMFSQRYMPQLSHTHVECQPWLSQILGRELLLCTWACTAQALLFSGVQRSRHVPGCVTPWPPCSHLSHTVTLSECLRGKVMQK